MGKIKLYELAKEMNVSSKELLETAKSLGLKIKSHLSNIEDEDIKKLKEKFIKNAVKETTKKEDNKVKKDLQNKKDNPVIIRREVIFEEENRIVPKEENKKQEKQNPFVQRNQKKDYNIVYRNKVEKPMTVSELFGLNKENKTKQKDMENKREMKIKENQEKTEIKKEVKKEEMIVNIKKQEEPQKQNNNQIKVQDKKNQAVNYNKNDNNYQNKRKDGFKQNQNNFQRKDNNFRRNNNDKNWQKDRQNNFNNNRNNNQNEKNGYNNREKSFNNRRPLDEKGIEKNIKNIMTVDMNIEEKNIHEFNRNMDKQKNNNKFEETKSNKKKNMRRNQGDFSINEKKLNTLKQRNNLSNMFEDQEDSMLDFYDLTTRKRKKGKEKECKNRSRTY